MEPPILEACKKGKKPTNFYGYHTFAEPGCPISLHGPFRDNIRQFLQECAELEEYNVEGMPVWCTFLVLEKRGLVLPLYTIEENVKISAKPFCDPCRCAGWSHHLVSKRKYHVIIPMDDEWNKPLNEGVLDLQNHLLHGLIHCNGFGHLLIINGIEGGSNYLCGREIMDLWDRLCSLLHTRQITVEDLSKKHKMDLRLLYGVAYGHSWFGRWGYQFFQGSFGVKEHNYSRAIEILSSLELDQVINDCCQGNGCRDIGQIIRLYRDMSETNLTTIRDLFRFMLTLKSRDPPGRNSTTLATFTYSSKILPKIALWDRPVGKERSMKCRKFSKVAANMDSRWPVRRLQNVAEVIVEALKEKRAAKNVGSSGMTRQEARDAARIHIGDTGLIDHVLKAMNNVIVGNYIVRRAVNRSTRVLEYSIQDLKGGTRIDPIMIPRPMMFGKSVYFDVTYLYKNVLQCCYSESNYVKLAVQTIMDSKHFVKDWPFRDEADDLLRYICQVMPSSIDLKNELTRDFPPAEYIVVPLHATIGDLKLAVQSAMRDTYCVMEQLLVTDIVEIEGVDDEEVLFGLIESGAQLQVRVSGLDWGTDLRYEGGADTWTVRCKCGALDDDGERMVSCDICEIWQHTRCSGIEDPEVVPRLFVCDTCCTSLAPPRMQSSYDFEHFPASALPRLSELDMGILKPKHSVKPVRGPPLVASRRRRRRLGEGVRGTRSLGEVALASHGSTSFIHKFSSGSGTMAAAAAAAARQACSGSKAQVHRTRYLSASLSLWFWAGIKEFELLPFGIKGIKIQIFRPLACVLSMPSYVDDRSGIFERNDIDIVILQLKRL
ncbi:PHD finger protein MALE MEIOCYTE DEATH 1 [Abeliophyllum distichum]|uniref:PHD finger protein MALE MEIOCYTE DEATH 1 n=1 Tax=Abeliophyllum distichum TaxID=126358 RepID=A0ABD1SUQ7_9LAMI